MLLACKFFHATKLAANHMLVGKELAKGGNAEPLTANDFLMYLEVSGAYPRTPNGLRVAQIVGQMVSAGLLVRAGYGNRSFGGWVTITFTWRRSGTCSEMNSDLRACLVHITGTDDDGGMVAGTGLVVHPSYDLTCRHVVSDMKVDNQQTFQGTKYAVNKESIQVHSEVDVGVIRLDGAPLTSLKGAIFQAPVVAQTVSRLATRRSPVSWTRP